ncbi:MAG: hypothetical protein JWO67_1118 [Streptosporangiaceae bacterium]|nr:hypothetical protein [Streptosporangiaceae bacterium]
MATYVDLSHRVTVTDQPEAKLNRSAAKRGQPFVSVDLGALYITLDDPAHARRIAKAFTDAADIQEAALATADHAFTRPGQVAPDRPARDACMVCGQPEAAHAGEGDA